MNTTDLSAPRAGRRRRFHSPQFKAEVVGACRPGVSIAGVALDNGINANLLRRWVHAAERTHRTSLAEASAIDAVGSTGSVVRWLRLSEHRSSFDKWSPAGLASVQSCPRRRSDGACDVPADRRGGQLMFTAQAACLIAGSVAK